MILTFFLLSMLVLLADGWTDGWSTMNLFCVYRSSWRDPLGYIRLFCHVLGHANWEHFLNNMLLLLVVGPPMEEKYGSIPLLKGILFTALVTGVLQCILFPHTGLLGASGIVFMLIMLSSLAGFSGGIPVTMLLVAALYFGHYHDDRHTELLLQILHQFKDLRLNGHIKCRSRLICDQNIRFTDQCHGNHHTLAHTTG